MIGLQSGRSRNRLWYCALACLLLLTAAYAAEATTPPPPGTPPLCAQSCSSMTSDCGQACTTSCHIETDQGTGAEKTVCATSTCGTFKEGGECRSCDKVCGGPKAALTCGQLCDLPNSFTDRCPKCAAPSTEPPPPPPPPPGPGPRPPEPCPSGAPRLPDGNCPPEPLPQVSGKIALLRVNEVGSPANDLGGEVVVKLDTKPEVAFLLELRPNPNLPQHRAAFKTLLAAYARKLPVLISYQESGTVTGFIRRVDLGR